MEHFQTVLEQNLESLVQNTSREQNLRNIWSSKYLSIISFPFILKFKFRFKS